MTDMTFTDAELTYLNSQTLGRLATLRPDGTLQASPIGFTVNENGTVDIGGMFMAKTQKYRNVEATGQVALVVDDLASTDPWRVRCVEIRGTAEAVPGTPQPGGSDDGALIRIHPKRVISFGLDLDVPPHEMTMNARDV